MTRESLWSPAWLMESQVPRSWCLFLPPPTCTSAERTHGLCRLQLCDSLGLAVMHYSHGKTGSFTVLLAAVWFIPFHKTQERAVLASSQESGSSPNQSIPGPSPLHTILIREDWFPLDLGEHADGWEYRFQASQGQRAFIIASLIRDSSLNYNCPLKKKSHSQPAADIPIKKEVGKAPVWRSVEGKTYTETASTQKLVHQQKASVREVTAGLQARDGYRMRGRMKRCRE